MGVIKSGNISREWAIASKRLTSALIPPRSWLALGLELFGHFYSAELSSKVQFNPPLLGPTATNQLSSGIP